MLKQSILFLTVVVSIVSVHACVDPDYVFGIYFNGEETIDTAVIGTIGEEGVNYRIDAYNIYTFRGHYDPSTMVSFSADGVRFVIDTSVRQLEGFPFGTCIRTELDWLVEAGILAMDRVKRERVEQAFTIYEGRSSYYWTKQDTLLMSSWLYREDGTLEGINCVGSGIAVDLPPQSLVVAVRSINDNRHLRRKQGMPVTVVHGQDQANRIFDISGRMVFPKRMAGVKARQSGALLLYNRRSGVVKKILQLP